MLLRRRTNPSGATGRVEHGPDPCPVNCALERVDVAVDLIEIGIRVREIQRRNRGPRDRNMFPDQREERRQSRAIDDGSMHGATRTGLSRRDLRRQNPGRQVQPAIVKIRVDVFEIIDQLAGDGETVREALRHDRAL